MPKYIIFFHYPCQDGLASAWVATRKLTDYELFPYQHGGKLNTNFENKTIYFLDMAPSIENLQKLKEKNTVYVLDHHSSNQKDYSNIEDPNVKFDMNLSGAGLTWNFFHPNEPIPMFLQMIQDRDLWKFKVKNSKEFCESLFFSCGTVETIEEQLDIFDEIFNHNLVKNYVSTGAVMLKEKLLKVRRMADKFIKKIYNFEGHKVCMVNVESELISDLGNELSSRKECDFAVLWRYDHTTEKYNISMRSDNKVDVSELCKRFGGGGHKNASGCTSETHPVKLFQD